MSVVTAVKYLAEFAAEALRPWDPSRELAARLLADLPLMVRLRRDDEATADEVTYLVLGRFRAEPPAVEGKDYLPTVGANWSRYGKCPKCKAGAGSPCVFIWDGTEAPIAHQVRPLADAATLVAEAVAVLDEPKARQWRDRDGDIWVEQPWEGGSVLAYTDLMGDVSGRTFEHVERECGPLVEVPTPVTELPAPAVWDGSVPPGGFVCSVCRTPVESEPCELHGAVTE